MGIQHNSDRSLHLLDRGWPNYAKKKYEENNTSKRIDIINYFINNFNFIEFFGQFGDFYHNILDRPNHTRNWDWIILYRCLVLFTSPILRFNRGEGGVY
jgi:hypothetical protein